MELLPCDVLGTKARFVIRIVTVCQHCCCKFTRQSTKFHCNATLRRIHPCCPGFVLMHIQCHTLNSTYIHVSTRPSEVIAYVEYRIKPGTCEWLLNFVRSLCAFDFLFILDRKRETGIVHCYFNYSQFSHRRIILIIRLSLLDRRLLFQELYYRHCFKTIILNQFFFFQIDDISLTFILFKSRNILVS